MANNIVSELLVSQSKQGFVMNCVERERQLKDYAAKLDRLVEAVEDLFRFVREKHNIPSGQEFACPYFIQLHAALRDIELPSEVK